MEWRPGTAFSLADAGQLARICSLQAQPAQLCCEQAGGQQVWVRYMSAFERRFIEAGVSAGQYLQQAA
ncbi:hypothetical protein [Hymenobacter ruricola]|uniref:Uncharacterized protein n=1 Tax=Hymenobacter ruricola TaxID=2791023 RepID=A0ABS0I4J4_9BACT|nr:hypothetical protein [Hymenobacter ruricola]MBF9221706.1 hypothetical protein [Hymenobacter ruricola]